MVRSSSFGPTSILCFYKEPSLRLVPPQGGPSKASVKDTANELGIHDALRNGPRSLSNEIKGGSAIQQRLENVSAGLNTVPDTSFDQQF